MRKSLFQKAVCFVLSLAALFGLLAFTVSAGVLKGEGSAAATLDEMKSLVGTVPYAEYLEKYPESSDAVHKGLQPKQILNTSIEAGGSAVFVSESEECKNSYDMDKSLWAEFDWEANAETSLYLPSAGSVTWQVEIPKEHDSLYYIKFEYYNCTTSESSVSTIERKLYIDSEIPFSEASFISMAKHWTYDNISVSEPLDVEEGDKAGVVYETRNDGYYKIVTQIDGSKKVVTTYKISQDINGNSMASTAVQHSRWNTYYCQDSSGYNQGYFKFYLAEGTRRITLSAVREPVIIKSVQLIPYDYETSSIPDYDDVLAEYEKNGYTAPKNNKDAYVIEAEFPDFVSDSSVYATNDTSSVANYPSSSKSQLYNVIGENSYSSMGQWAAYKFTVAEDGLYKFGMRYKQSALQGMYICRAIKISGGAYGDEPAVPFQQAYDVQFDYSDAWQSSFVGDRDEDGNIRVFEFYFEKGVEYTLYLECSLGSLKDLIKRVSDSMNRINSAYLKILQLTGNAPDEYTDYRFLEVMPDVLITLLEEAKELEAVKAALEELCGTTGSHITTLHTIALLLDTMGSNDGYNVAANMATLKSYLGTLGTWINSSQTSSMMLDSISVCPADADNSTLKRANPNFFQSFIYEIASFFNSFFTNYEAMGLTIVPDEDSRHIDVWLATGRDQSNIWRSLIDAEDSFTDATGVAVSLKLVAGGTLLPSILSGKGPDVYMGLASTDVINFAIRDAVVGISGNDRNLDKESNEVFKNEYYTYKAKNGSYYVTDEYEGDENLTHVSRTFEDTIDGNFADVAMDTITLLDVSYGVPETMSMAMMFYRMDVLANLGQEVPDTWDQLLALLPVLQSNNMMMGVSYASAVNIMIYQMGGNMWKLPNDPKYAGYEVDLDSDIALEAFEYVCRLYSEYSFPISFDAANRFRTGEMPIIIGDYAGTYNQMVVYATEIAGLWEFSSVPGVIREDGVLNYDSLVTASATVMLYGCEDTLAAWQFIQWQTGAEVQAEYGNKMVALIGPSAKYATANLGAIKNLSWTASEREAIEEQMEHISSIVNYPGSYIIDRYTKFAFLEAVNEGANPTEALQGYIDAINDEIARKRSEFDLEAPSEKE